MNKNEIVEFLEADGIRYHMKGFHVLADAIDIASDCGMGFRMMDINAELAKRCRLDENRAERNMRYAIQSVYPEMTVKAYIARAIYKLGAE